jgi:glutamyl-tRNA synthetase
MPVCVCNFRALGYSPPAFAHLPLILNKDGSKLSKRQGDISIDYYRKKQYYPEALVNFVMGNVHEVESLEEIALKVSSD